MRQLDNILTEIHWRNMEMWSTAFVKIRISVHFIYNYACWFLWLWCNWLSLKMILPEVWGLCLSLMDEQSSSSFSQTWGRSRFEFLTFVLFGVFFFSCDCQFSFIFHNKIPGQCCSLLWRHSAALFLSVPHTQPSLLRMWGSACGLFLFSLQWLWHF